MQHTLRIFVSYLGRHKFMLLIVSILVTVSALANLLGTYMIRPVVNNLANGDLHSLAIGVLVAAGIFAIGALAVWGYSQTMVKAAQQVVFDIRRDLFAHMQTLPLRFFDQKRHGDIMSLFTNDIDTIADALNNSFAMAIQSFIQMIGTLVILYILNWKLSLIVTVCYGIMFWYMKFSGAKSKVFYAKQQQSLGELDGYIEEMVSGQKVVKVFNHEQASLQEFLEKNEKLRKEGTGAQSYAATMVPVVVSISYINYAIVAVLGGILAMRGMADVGSLASYLVFVRQAALPINQFTQQSNFLLSALAGAERVFDVMNLEPEVDEGDVTLVNVRKENGILKECQEKTGKWAWRSKDGELTMLRGDVRFENVDFGYTKEHMILKNISLRMGKCSVKESFVRIENGEVFIYGMHISPYEKGNIFNKDPMRVKKLLMHRYEINKIEGKIAEKGYTLVPLKVYFKGSLVKVSIGLAKGKKLYDKRQDIAKKDMRREAEREFKVRNL